MSYSSLWLVDKNYIGREEYIFSNSWLFSPIVWDILSEKYLPKDRFGFNQSIINGGEKVWVQLNEIMNNSDNNYERICWEMSNSAIFFSKDKKIVSKAIRDFLSENNQYDKNEEDGICILEREHIIERWNEIANTLDNIDENTNPYFVFKNTSVDDSVSSWFEKYNEDLDKWNEVPITSKEEILTAFIIIKNDKIVDFVPNNKIIDYKTKMRGESG